MFFYIKKVKCIKAVIESVYLMGVGVGEIIPRARDLITKVSFLNFIFYLNYFIW